MSHTTTATYVVTGMTCGHCVASVTEEVGSVAGISAVTVDLESGRLELTGDGANDVEAVRRAVEEAGYELEVPR